MTDNEPPEVPAVRNKDGNLIISCPWCGQRHTHGGGGSLAVGSGDGHRCSHCVVDVPGRGAGYIIREVQPTTTEEQ